MRGEIEILVGGNTVYKDTNMIVDGAGSLLADIMTAPRAYEDIPSASSILDASNYTIQAISFGKGTAGYLKNAHQNLEEKTKYFISNVNPVIVTTKQESDVNDSVASSILWGVDSLPESPNPFNKKLNLNCLAHSALTISGTNMIQDPNDFVDPGSAWVFADNCSGTDNTHIAPDGTLTADTIFSNGGDPLSDNVVQDVLITPIKDAVYNYSIYLRKDDTYNIRSQHIIFLIDNDDGYVKERIEFSINLDTGAVEVTSYYSQGSSAYTEDNIRVTDAGDYWFVEVLDFKDYAGICEKFRIRHYPGEALGVAQDLTLWGSNLYTTFSNTQVQDFGHNLNLIPSAIHSQVLEGSSNYTALAGSIFGCWPEGESQGGTVCYVFSSIEDNQFGINPDSNLEFSSGVYDASSGYFAQSGTLYGYFNEASSMDYSGYVNMIMSSVPHGSYSMSDSSGGLTLSAATDFSSTGMIEYECTMASGDAVAAQLYGGIYNMGLWAMDVNSSLKAGYTPPLSFDVINNQKRYKLFSRKDLTTSLTQYQDTYGLTGSFTGNHYPATKPAAEKVTIKWRIYFL